MELRELEESNLLPWWALRLRGLAEHPEGFGQSYEDASLLDNKAITDRYRSSWEGDDSFILVAIDEDEKLGERTIIGTVGIVRDSGKKRVHKASLWGMYVRPESRGRGVGRALVARAVEVAKSVWPELLQIRLSVVTTNASAGALYRSLGFSKYGFEKRALQLPDDEGRPIFLDEEHLVLDLATPERNSR